MTGRVATRLPGPDRDRARWAVGPEAERDSPIGVVDDLRAEGVAMERNRPVPVADRDHHMVEPHLSRHAVSLPDRGQLPLTVPN